MNADPQQLCPDCGTWVTIIIQETGWCVECSVAEGYILATVTDIGSTSTCLSCGNVFHPDYPNRMFCSTCRKSRPTWTQPCCVCGRPLRGTNRAWVRWCGRCYGEFYQSYVYWRWRKHLPISKVLAKIRAAAAERGML